MFNLYAKKPKQDGECGECGQKAYWSGNPVLEDLCASEFERLGIPIKPGECIQLKVTRVQD